MATEFVQLDLVARMFVTPEPPLRGVRDTAASNVISWNNGTTQSSAPAGSSAVSISFPPNEEVARWMFQMVEPSGAVGALNRGLRARGVVVDVFVKHPGLPNEILSLIVQTKDGYYELAAADAGIVSNQ